MTTTRVSQTVLLDAIWPRLTHVQNALLVVGGSLFVALCAQLSFPLPMSPVPVTGQTYAVLLLGATFGPRRAAASLLVYLAEGAAGLPVFAPGGLPGIARLFGPTGGYLLAFPLAAYLMGWLVERMPRRVWWRWLGAVLGAEAVIFTLGVTWLKLVSGVAWAQAAQLGLLPFLPALVFKTALLTVCLPASWWAVERRSRA